MTEKILIESLDGSKGYVHIATPTFFTKYLNNERKLYDYIKRHKNRDNVLVSTDDLIANRLGVSKISVLRWRKRLVDLNLISYSSKWVCGKKQGIFMVL